MLDNDLPHIERAVGLVDKYCFRLNCVCAEFGVRQQSPDVLKDHLETKMFGLRAVLAEE
ncbi:MAG: hypothetical protein NZ899_13440 [Thermoguttaceae bacterium]|nr:hypothetical protein [Thermoguttaceae bacterium]MDW8077251.1 hypothetical protein [Thermoguttaceae bacterium]